MPQSEILTGALIKAIVKPGAIVVQSLEGAV